MNGGEGAETDEEVNLVQEGLCFGGRDLKVLGADGGSQETARGTDTMGACGCWSPTPQALTKPCGRGEDMK